MMTVENGHKGGRSRLGGEANPTRRRAPNVRARPLSAVQGAFPLLALNSLFSRRLLSFALLVFLIPSTFGSDERRSCSFKWDADDKLQVISFSPGA
jgi:hypothetical protein